ncbi:Telomeric repeat binding protein [Phytophthora palmivora]|uniref:Telomeric repeat binding protein n=1 Tax=Phytophthora palmivora TaxID=4796 RepID=A0A2P4X4V4_9STRA|nr:Telomeric repeat binding protein [Phytophthora palmivora]
MTTPSSRPTTPSIATNRRSSISSVASSGRRKDQSLLDVASSLGQRTPERSEPMDDGASTRSRQLDFDSIDGGDVDEESRGEDDNAQGGGDGQDEAEEVPRPRRRRVKVFWSTAEVEFLRQGVETYGVGNWKTILSAGQDVFLSHRTNVDLKDKWKNLAKNPTPKRPRSNTSDPLDAVKDANVKSEGNGVVVDSVLGSVTLKFATDNSFPELVEVSVDLNICKDVSALKEHLRSSILSDVSPGSGIQMIGLKSRDLFDDDEHLTQCIRQNGVDFYLIFEENPEEFV